jgi:Zn-dependent peptidase ImmA (M78 family)
MRENPWRTLRSRPHLILEWRRLPDGMGGMWTPGRIVLDSRLNQVERRCVLMHELVHDERQIGWPFATEATMEREEAIVRAETADRLVPPAELLELVSLDGGEPVTAELVAAEFDVTIGVANLALRRLQGSLLDRARSKAAHVDRDAA